MTFVREKVHRLPRPCYRGEVTVSFTVGMNKRAQVFADPVVVEQFLRILSRAVERHDCIIPAYCFMLDHLHVIVHGQSSDADLWKAMVDFKQNSGYWLCKNSPGASWQKDFHDHVIRPGGDLAAHIRYVLENPCMRGLVSDWHKHLFSGSVSCSLDDVLAGLPL